MPIFEAIVTEPPTSGEIRTRVAEAIQSGLADELLQLTVLGEQEVPAPEPTEVTFRVARTTHVQGGTMQIAGPTTEGGSIIINCAADPSTPATASLVTV